MRELGRMSELGERRFPLGGAAALGTLGARCGARASCMMTACGCQDVVTPDGVLAQTASAAVPRLVGAVFEAGGRPSGRTLRWANARPEQPAIWAALLLFSAPVFLSRRCSSLIMDRGSTGSCGGARVSQHRFSGRECHPPQCSALRRMLAFDAD